MLTALENKVMEILEVATVTNVSTDVVQGIDDLLLDWNQYSDYPRLIVIAEDYVTLQEQVGGAALQKEYTINIFLLVYNKNKAELVRQRDVLVERIESTLRANKRLDNLADNNERVYNSYIPRVRVSKSGINVEVGPDGESSTNGEFYGVAWIELKVDTDRLRIS